MDGPGLCLRSGFKFVWCWIFLSLSISSSIYFCQTSANSQRTRNRKPSTFISTLSPYPFVLKVCCLLGLLYRYAKRDGNDFYMGIWTRWSKWFKSCLDVNWWCCLKLKSLLGLWNSFNLFFYCLNSLKLQ